MTQNQEMEHLFKTVIVIKTVSPNHEVVIEHPPRESQSLPSPYWVTKKKRDNENFPSVNVLPICTYIKKKHR